MSFKSEALKYMKANREKVQFLIQEDKIKMSVRPSLSEMDSPQSWIGPHWRWILEEIKRDRGE